MAMTSETALLLLLLVPFGDGTRTARDDKLRGERPVQDPSQLYRGGGCSSSPSGGSITLCDRRGERRLGERRLSCFRLPRE